MTDPVFTILMPVARPPDLMPFAIQSILTQSRGDFELVIIGDGAPAATIEAANRASAQDSRISVLAFAKGTRHGEAHRDTVLQKARGRFVCHLADDDLWFPEHLEEMAALLRDFEFGHLVHVNITADGRTFIALADLADPKIQARMAAETFNFFGPSNAGYRVGTYRRLLVGWSPAPEGIPTDLAMWRKFLALPGIAAGTRFAVTSLHFADAQRRDWPMERRRNEIALYAAIAADHQGRDRLRQQALGDLAREHVARHDYVLSLLKRAEDAEARLASARASEP